MPDEKNIETREDLQAELNRYAKAVEEEYKESTSVAPENTEAYTRDFFKKNIHSAAAQVVWLTNNAESESVRLTASKYVIEQALTDASKDGDPIKDLLNQLTAKENQPGNSTSIS